MSEFVVTGTRTRNDKENRFKAPVEAESEEEAPSEFLDQVEESGEFNIEAVK